MTSTDGRGANGRSSAFGSTVGILLVLLAELFVMTMVYHSGDAANQHQASWARVEGAQSAWMVGDPTTAVQLSLGDLDGQIGSRAAPVDAAFKAWVASPTADRFKAVTDATDTLGESLARSQTMAGVRAALINILLLFLASVGWFTWFRRVVRRQRELQSYVTEFEVAMAGERRLTALVRNSVDLVMVIDPDTTVSFASPSTVAVLGRSPGELVGERIGDLLSAEDLPLVTSQLASSSQSDQVVLLHAVHANGRALVLEGTLTNLLADETVNGWVLTVRDVTERLALQGELSHQALHDSLTGLANRQLFTERLSHALRRRSGSLRPLVVLFLDLDDFKNVNDSLGHGVGDALLRQFADRVVATIPQGDTAARLGGDEFAVLMEDTDLATAQAVAAQLVDSLATPLSAGQSQLAVRCSIGLAVAHPGKTSAEEVLRNADVAMYFAKDRGKARVAVYDPELHATALRRLEVRSELNLAIQSGDLVLHYQPTYLMKTGKLDGYEALVRWNHPIEGLLYPDHFIEIAEQSGLIVPLGRWVLNEACRAAATELTTPGLTPVMAVNVSARQLAEPGFFDEVVTALAESGLDPSRLVLEITESILLNDRSMVIDILTRLRELGVHMAIDDFGTGYSSLSYLADLPVEILKIDKSFVDGIGNGGESLVEAIISLSASLGLVTLAEGVEEPHQMEWLCRAGCEVGQGYFWARPMPLSRAREVLLSSRTSETLVG